jgi:DNA-binding NtrC family response regulator
VVVLDLLMPGMDGIQTLKALHELHPDLPVIILSGHSAEERAAQGARHGAIDYLLKPCDLGQLVEAITRAVGTGARAIPDTGGSGQRQG